MNKNKYAIIAGMLSALVITSADAANSNCPDEFYKGQAPNLTNQAFSKKTMELCSMNFSVMYSGISRTPLWSAEKLTAANLALSGSIKRKNTFHADDRVPGEDRAELNDFKRSGFDRGHLSPSGDMPTVESQNESFALSNMVPQNPRDNRHIWEGIESAVRTMAKERGTLYLVTGPIFADQHMQALNNRVLIPSHMFKAVMDPVTGEMGAYVSQNNDSDQWNAMSVADLEKSIGWDLFPGVPLANKQQLMHLGNPTPHFGNDSEGEEEGVRSRKVKF